MRVLITPAFVQTPLPQTVVAGGTVTLSATYTGNPPPFTNEWRLGSTPLYTYVTPDYSSFFTFTAPTNPGVQQYRFVIKSASSPLIGVSHPLVSITIIADSDLDGLPDTWENTHFGSDIGGDPAIDSDGDTMTNREEYIAGTNPQDAASYLQINEVGAGQSATISFQALSNKTYSVDYRDDLASPAWTKLADVVAVNSNRTATVIDPAPSDTRFYRLSTPRQP